MTAKLTANFNSPQIFWLYRMYKVIILMERVRERERESTGQGAGVNLNIEAYWTLHVICNDCMSIINWMS